MERKKIFRPDKSEEVNYSFQNYPIYISEGALSMCPNYRFPSHWHDDIEFIAVISGQMDYNVNGKTVHLFEGEGIFINSKQLHFGFSDEKNECEFICILLHPRLLCAETAFEKDFIFPITDNGELSQIKLSPNINWQNEIFDLIVQANQIKNEKTAPLKVQSIFGYIWSLICENVDISKNFKSEDPNLTVVKKMVKFINSNYRENITLFSIASSGGVGESKCCKLFRRYLNTTPNSYLRLYRLERARELLETSDLTITEIACSVGFGGSSYFSESFKQVYGVTPREIRSRN